MTCQGAASPGLGANAEPSRTSATRLGTMMARRCATHRKYPDPSDFPVPGRMFYDLQSPDHYIVGFGVGFDEQYYFDSVRKKWSFEGDDESKG